MQIPSPCFVLEEDLLLKNLRLLNDVQEQSGGKIILALKGFSMYSTFKTVKEYLSGATASSLNEARLIFEEMGCYAHTYAPVYYDAEFEELMSYSSHITFNSLQQFNHFKDRVSNYSRKISMGLRVNPQYAEVETDMYNPCIVGSRLGITRDLLGENLPPEIEGLHFHTLCENDSFVLERTLKHVEEKFGDLLPKIKWLNMGGGHLMTKKGYNTNHVISVIKKLKEKYGLGEIILEPGSAIAWETGFLKSTVMDIVDAQGINVAILDVSFAAHMPDTLEMPYKPRIKGAYQEPVDNKPTYRMGGTTCLAGDFMGDYSFDQELKIGDELIFEDMIHYTMVKTTTFNGVNLPSIGIINTEKEFKLWKSFGFETFKDRL